MGKAIATITIAAAVNYLVTSYRISKAYRDGYDDGSEDRVRKDDNERRRRLAKVSLTKESNVIRIEDFDKNKIKKRG